MSCNTTGYKRDTYNPRWQLVTLFAAVGRAFAKRLFVMALAGAPKVATRDAATSTRSLCGNICLSCPCYLFPLTHFLRLHPPSPSCALRASCQVQAGNRVYVQRRGRLRCSSGINERVAARAHGAESSD
eukprot:1707548-Pleurochrysis_carterae.AAC.1